MLEMLIDAAKKVGIVLAAVALLGVWMYYYGPKQNASDLVADEDNEGLKMLERLGVRTSVPQADEPADEANQTPE